MAGGKSSFGGTFFQHPLVMAAATQTLRELRDRGPGFKKI
jgi:glutamate-1-semialdehyde aminotransferase